MTGYLMLFLMLAVCFLAVGCAVGRYDKTRQGSAAGISLCAWIAFLLCGASVVAACFMVVLHNI